MKRFLAYFLALGLFVGNCCAALGEEMGTELPVEETLYQEVPELEIEFDSESIGTMEPNDEVVLESTDMPTEAPTLESIEELIELPTEEPTAEPTQLPTLEQLEVLVQECDPPEIRIAADWSYDAHANRATIPVSAAAEKFQVEWTFDGAASDYLVQTAPLSESDEAEQIATIATVSAEQAELKAADYLNGWYTLYITARMADGNELRTALAFCLEVVQEEELPSEEQQTEDALVIEEAVPQTAEELAEFFGISIEELAEGLEIDMDELLAMGEEEIGELYLLYGTDNIATYASTSMVTITSAQVLERANAVLGTQYSRGYCLGWVNTQFWMKLGAASSTACCAYVYGTGKIASTSQTNIPIGANVYFSGGSTPCTCGRIAGHIGVYVGDGYVINLIHYSSDPDKLSTVRKNTISQIVSWGYTYRGWGYPVGVNLVDSDGPIAPTLQFTNVTYPKTFKINTTNGWALGAGTLQSNSQLKTIRSQILNSSGTVISESGVKNISGYNYNIAALDTYSNSDNGVKFSQIKSAGSYTWRLIGTDSAGRSLTLDMPITVVSSGSTVTATASKTYANDIAVTGVSLNSTSLTLEREKSATLTATVAPSNATNKTITWTSSNTSVATVSSGTVKAVAVGTATITAATSNGKSASCKITVKDPATSTLKFVNVTYPKTFKINTTNGWALVGGTLQSNNQLKTIRSQILNSSGMVISESGVKSISGYSYNIVSLDTYSYSDNGVKFSQIKSAGSYTWRLIATDATGSSLTLNMPFTAISSGSTVTATASNNYTSTATPTAKPTATPTAKPTATPTAKPTATPTAKPTATPTPKPTVKPTAAPTPIPASGIKLNFSQLYLGKGQTVNTLKAVVSPDNAGNKSVTWSSSNTSVAKVDASSGAITCVANKGSATITAATANGLKANCTVTAQKRGATGISLTSSKTVVTGRYFTLKAKLSGKPTKSTVTWTSSNSSIATVNSKGKVTGKAPGTATITATSASGYQASCKVTVQNQPVTRVKLSKTSASLQNGKTVQLKATISPSNAYNKAVKWTSSDESVAKVNASGLVTALKPGTATIRCTAQDGSGKAASCKVTVKKTAVTKVQLTYNGKTAKKLTLSYASEKGKNNTGFAGKALPSNATVQGVTWKSSNSKVISIDAATGAFQVVGVGKATISCIAKDNAKKKASCTITVKKR